MIKHWIFLGAFMVSLPVFAQDATEICLTNNSSHGEKSEGERSDRKRKEMRDLSPEEKEKMQERRLQLMEDTLKNIGVTDEQKDQIFQLQQEQRENMKAAYKQIEENKRNLSALERSDASQAEIFAAIDAVSSAQADQMKILALNRMQMEQILGKEKFKLFMDSARNKWREHGRHGGSGVPPRPGVPPLPNTGNKTQPPKPSPIPALPQS
jgi:Spy/CpxP family protein refolding chaperone